MTGEEVAIEDIDSPYVDNKIHLKKVTPFHAQWEIIKIRSWRFFAHHPVCSRYKNHYFNLFGIKLCIGCTSIYAGIILFTILFFSVPSFFQARPYINATTPFVGFLGATLHLIFKFKNKWVKAFLRFLAGFSIAAFLGIVYLTPDWYLRFGLLTFLWAGNRTYAKARGPGANNKLCITCPLRTGEPSCKPHKNTNIRIRKLYRIIDRELAKARNRRRKTHFVPEKQSVTEGKQD